ncbi:MAG: 1-acyl-sn-glycerol-3-phosphate acyltransferase [Bacilli bacterium]|nr:1-acyl-sn-glycerol-3-phosphate acyltransferase [Bacilli bacterium]
MSREYKLQLLNKIKDYELLKKFNEDIESDPPYKTLKPEDVRYINKKKIHIFKTYVANRIAINHINKLIKKKQLIIEDVIGLENLMNVCTKQGCILTCNHFNPFDNFALHAILQDYLFGQHKHLYKVIREGNYSFKGLYGFFFRNCNTLPLSSNFDTMKKFTRSIKEVLLEEKEIVLIYPEQSMWWNYKLPRPLKIGAFKYAKNFNVPIVPCFITMRDSDILDPDGFYIQKYTIHFLEPIFPNKESTPEDLMNQNYNVWKKTYEEFYNVPLQYKSLE